MNLNQVIVQDDFIDRLFQHSYFQYKLKSTVNSYNNHQSYSKLPSIDHLVEDITTSIMHDITSLHDKVYQKTQQEIQQIHNQIGKLKDQCYSQTTKVDSTTKSMCQEGMFEDQPFELSSIKQTINNLQQKVREINLSTSCILDNSQFLKQSQFKQDFIQETISKQINKIQLSFSHQQETLEEIFNKKMEKQQKTINNILETLNQLHPIPLSVQKTSSAEKAQVRTLANSRSADKLKSFFGFN